MNIDKILENLGKIKGITAVDTETDGLKRNRQIIGISFCTEDLLYFYIPLKKWNGVELVNALDENQVIVENAIASVLGDKSNLWVGHNTVFDAIAINNKWPEINIIDRLHSDTALLHHTCISEDPPHGLKLLATKYIDTSAADEQEDLKESVKANGGLWKKDQKDFYRGSVDILSKYGAKDALYTMQLHKLWYSEIEKQNLQNLWLTEVLPLTKVMYELNSTGLKIDKDYFEKLKIDIGLDISRLKENIINSNLDSIREYEYKKLQKDLKITKRSKAGKHLLNKGLAQLKDETLLLADGAFEELRKLHELETGESIFSLNSRPDLAYFLYEILKLPVLSKTKTGSPSTDSDSLDELLNLMEVKDENLEGIKKISKEKKILNTYIEPILENQIDGRIYPQFNQIGTSSGRFTSGEPINFQTLPKDDLRIKRGFISDEGMVIINADFSSLEPRAFASVANEPELQKVYSEDLDLYSHIYIMMNKDYSVSAKESEPNFLKKVYPKERDKVKVYALGLVYGMSEYKLAEGLGCDVVEAKRIKDLYFKSFKNLLVYQNNCRAQIKNQHYVTNILGRKKRARLVSLITKKYPKYSTTDSKKMLEVFDLIKDDNDYLYIAESLKKKGKPIRDSRDFKYAVKNEYNNGYNFPIQGSAASIANMSCISLMLIKPFSILSIIECSLV